jgi:hypothetical protein
MSRPATNTVPAEIAHTTAQHALARLLIRVVAAGVGPSVSPPPRPRPRLRVSYAGT